MMGRLDEDVATVVETERLSAVELRNKIRGDMHVAAGDQADRDLRRVELRLQPRDVTADIGAGIVVDAGKDMRGAGDDRDAVGDRQTRHFKGLLQILGAVIDPGKEMAMKIDQCSVPMLFMPCCRAAPKDKKCDASPSPPSVRTEGGSGAGAGSGDDRKRRSETAGAPIVAATAKPCSLRETTEWRTSTGLIVGVGGNPLDQTHVPPGFDKATGVAVAAISRTRLSLPESSPSP
jgi:hypothetical protein